MHLDDLWKGMISLHQNISNTVLLVLTHEIWEGLLAKCLYFQVYILYVEVEIKEFFQVDLILLFHIFFEWEEVLELDEYIFYSELVFFQPFFMLNTLFKKTI